MLLHPEQEQAVSGKPEDDLDRAMQKAAEEARQNWERPERESGFGGGYGRGSAWEGGSGGYGGAFGRISREKAGPFSQDEQANEMTREEVDAKLETVEARTDAKFAQLIGEFDTKLAGLRGDMLEIKASLAPLAGLKSTIVITSISSVIALAALLLGLLAYGGDRFGAGIEMSTVANEAARRAVEQALPRQTLGVIDGQPAAQTPE
jgi:hypothetical protein